MTCPAAPARTGSRVAPTSSCLACRGCTSSWGARRFHRRLELKGSDMRYDPSISALMHPEQQPPLGPSWPWNEAAILAECARLAYVRFETGGEAEETLKAALADFGYRNFAGFSHE